MPRIKAVLAGRHPAASLSRNNGGKPLTPVENKQRRKRFRGPGMPCGAARRSYAAPGRRWGCSGTALIGRQKFTCRNQEMRVQGGARRPASPGLQRARSVASPFLGGLAEKDLATWSRKTHGCAILTASDTTFLLPVVFLSLASLPALTHSLIFSSPLRGCCRFWSPFFFASSLIFGGRLLDTQPPLPFLSWVVAPLLRCSVISPSSSPFSTCCRASILA